METTKPKSGRDNLKPIQSKAEARARGHAGGIRSGEARREKKLLSAIYTEFLADRYNVTGSAMLADTIAAILARGDSASVAMLREIREATEGSKTKMVGDDGGPVEISLIKRVIVA